MRINQHPILGDIKPKHKVLIEVDGKKIEAWEGEPIAAALTVAGIRAFRTTEKRQEPRGVFCAVGRCTDCVLTVNGVPNVRSCITPVKAGMKISTQRRECRWTPGR